MTPTDAYLERVARGLRGMDRRVREDILRELRSHLADAIAADGDRALAAAEPPESVAARYRELYGYGVAYRAYFATLAAVLGFLTVPVFVYAGLDVPGSLVASLLVLLGLVAYLILVAVRVGSRAGGIAGLAAAVGRVLAALALDAAGALLLSDPSGLVTFAAVSVGLVVLGYLPGRAREKWKPREPSL